MEIKEGISCLRPPWELCVETLAVRWSCLVCPSPVCPFFQVDSIEDTVKDRLQLVQRGQAGSLEEKEKNELKKRKLLSEV